MNKPRDKSRNNQALKNIRPYNFVNYYISAHGSAYDEKTFIIPENITIVLMGDANKTLLSYDIIHHISRSIVNISLDLAYINNKIKENISLNPAYPDAHVGIDFVAYGNKTQRPVIVEHSLCFGYYYEKGVDEVVINPFGIFKLPNETPFKRGTVEGYKHDEFRNGATVYNVLKKNERDLATKSVSNTDKDFFEIVKNRMCIDIKSINLSELCNIISKKHEKDEVIIYVHACRIGNSKAVLDHSRLYEIKDDEWNIILSELLNVTGMQPPLEYVETFKNSIGHLAFFSNLIRLWKVTKLNKESSQGIQKMSSLFRNISKDEIQHFNSNYSKFIGNPKFIEYINLICQKNEPNKSKNILALLTFDSYKSIKHLIDIGNILIAHRLNNVIKSIFKPTLIKSFLNHLSSFDERKPQLPNLHPPKDKPTTLPNLHPPKDKPTTLPNLNPPKNKKTLPSFRPSKKNTVVLPTIARN